MFIYVGLRDLSSTADITLHWLFAPTASVSSFTQFLRFKFIQLVGTHLTNKQAHTKKLSLLLLRQVEAKILSTISLGEVLVKS
jgi:hypothetical protein